MLASVSQVANFQPWSLGKKDEDEAEEVAVEPKEEEEEEEETAEEAESSGTVLDDVVREAEYE